MKRDGALNIRDYQEVLDDFTAAVESNNETVSDVLRRYIRAYIARAKREAK